jgi:uncharacterized protein (TIGR04255 family)
MVKFQYLMRLEEPCYDCTMSEDQANVESGYARPPITEAVIERHFSTQLRSDQLDSLRRKFEHEFAAVSQMAELAIAVGADGKQPHLSQTEVGYRLVNQEGTAILILTRQAIAYARLAPYTGWANFNAGASAVFKSAHDVMGYIPLGRLGVRYINRLDIPISQENGVPKPFSLQEYILVQPQYPEEILPALQVFTMQCVFFLQQIECLATINVASVPSPVPRHISFLFDIDIGRNTNIPQKESEIQNLLNSIRVEKNRIFDSCLTAKMKGMFH